jgi:hypothetical protein
MLFFVFGGLTIATQRKTHTLLLSKKTLFMVAGIGIVYTQLLFGHSLLANNGKRDIAQYVYPFDRTNLESLIEQKKQDKESHSTIASYIERYQKAFGVDAFRLEYVGDRYAEFGSTFYDRKALAAYEASFVWGGYIYGDSMVDRMEKLYTLKRDLEGQDSADSYITRYLYNYKRVLLKDPKEIQQNTYDAVIRKIESLKE